MLDQYTFHEMTFTWLDGVMLNTDGGTLFGPVPKAVWGRFYPSNDLNQIPTTADPILIQYQDKNYLIDASINLDKLTEKQQRNIGVHSNGDIEGSLAKVGLTRFDIDAVLMTHMHNDHASGLTWLEDGRYQSFYPNATIYINEKEWEDVQNPTNRTRNTYLKENWQPIVEQVQTFGETLEIASRIKMIHTGGHSRGHSIVRFEQNGEVIWHLADLLLTFVHTNPLWVTGVDDYPMDTITAKEAIMPEALEKNHRFIFYHDPFYRLVEYTKDGKNIEYALKCSKASPIPMTEKQDKAHKVIGVLDNLPQ